MAKTNTGKYTVTFPADALPGVRAVGHIKRGDSVDVDAAEALRLVRAKGLAFADPSDKSRAEAEVNAAAAAPAIEPTAAAAPPAADVTATEENAHG